MPLFSPILVVLTENMYFEIKLSIFLGGKVDIWNSSYHTAEIMNIMHINIYYVAPSKDNL